MPRDLVFRSGLKSIQRHEVIYDAYFHTYSHILKIYLIIVQRETKVGMVD